ncbi:hypothetical protein SETIT_5G085700v2 [Setaria italica]|uniref:Uncharacterized protein n=1 Tax=Setaria italica TaxID=4555 RepID=A0A368R2Z0_SETIT|nr:hypothetical protein SETIT_5G085700v2 [Setaria italica]
MHADRTRSVWWSEFFLFFSIRRLETIQGVHLTSPHNFTTKTVKGEIQLASKISLLLAS